jgi:hypothetical protein
MNYLRVARATLLGAWCGFLTGVALWIPSCIAGELSTPEKGDGTEVANACFVLSLCGGALNSEWNASDQQAEWESERRRKSEQDFKDRQESIRSDMMRLTEQSLVLFEDAPRRLLDAERSLNQAERDLSERALSPFWSSVELAITRPGEFDASIHMMSAHSQEYRQLASEYIGEPPTFLLASESIRGLAAASATETRLRAIVRKAHCDRDFAWIYEQRRTNQLLSAGFVTLAQALDEMGRRISTSIDGLSEQITAASTATVAAISQSAASHEAGVQSLCASVNAVRDEVRKRAAAGRERHDLALTMLDNIQRRRLPFP